MPKPRHHVPPIQRYSARYPDGIADFASVYVGVQGRTEADIRTSGFMDWVARAVAAAPGPDAFDFARYVDPQGFRTLFCAAYWLGWDRFREWRRQPAVTEWWDSPARLAGPAGCWLEAMRVPIERSETIHYVEYPAGVARCAGVRLETIQESGYFGAMRDRIAAAVSDPLDPAVEKLAPARRATAGARWAVEAPRNLVSIRSGVAWGNCGPEQMKGYQEVLRPLLDQGMEYLRAEGDRIGCCSLRQVTMVDPDGTERPEGYSQGYFLSLRHLEDWAHGHPTHLAIYKQAIADRKKYQERLELRTFHEVFVLPKADHLFEYANCHPRTGLLPFFEARRVAAGR